MKLESFRRRFFELLPRYEWEGTLGRGGIGVVFRALDAFRIFDNIFIMTGGANDTASFSLLTYNQTINRVEVGMGSALSVLLFLSVVVIALLFIKGFKVDLAEGRS